MGKIADVQLHSKAVILAQEGYSYSIIGDKLGRSKGWVAKWVERSQQDELDDRRRCGRPKVLTQAAIKLIKKAKYRPGFGLRQIEKSLKAGGLKGNKDFFLHKQVKSFTNLRRNNLCVFGWCWRFVPCEFNFSGKFVRLARCSFI